MKNLYKVLGVPPAAEPSEIRAKFRELARLYHPDAEGGGDAAKFSEVSHAHAVLADPEWRRAHDTRLQIAMDACRACSGKGVIFKQKSMVLREKELCPVCWGEGYRERH